MHRKFIEQCIKINNKNALKKYLELLKKLSLKDNEYKIMYHNSLKYSNKLIGGVKPPIPIKIDDIHSGLIEIYNIHKKIDEDLDNKSFAALVNQLKVTFLRVKDKDNTYILECYIPKNLAKIITEASDKYPKTEEKLADHLITDLKRTTYTDKVKSDYEFNKNAPIEKFVNNVIEKSRKVGIDDFLHLQDFTLRVVKPLTDLVLGLFCSKRLGIYHDDDCIIRKGGILAQFSQGTKTQVCKKLLFNLGTRMNMIYDLDPYVRTMAFLISAINDGKKLIPCSKNYMINVSFIYPTKYKNKPSNNDNDNNISDYIKFKFNFKNEVYVAGKKSYNNNEDKYPNYSNYSIENANDFVKVNANKNNIPLKDIERT